MVLITVILGAQATSRNKRGLAYALLATVGTDVGVSAQ